MNRIHITEQAAEIKTLFQYYISGNSDSEFFAQFQVFHTFFAELLNPSAPNWMSPVVKTQLIILFGDMPRTHLHFKTEKLLKSG